MADLLYQECCMCGEVLETEEEQKAGIHNICVEDEDEYEKGDEEEEEEEEEE